MLDYKEKLNAKLSLFNSINIVPFTDIILVLFIIFMISVPKLVLTKTPNRDGESLLINHRLWLASIIYFGPMSAILILRFLGLRAGLSSTFLFILGTSFEFLFFSICYIAYHKEKINYSQWKRYIYLIYTTVGLAFTIYLSHSPNYTFIIIIRFIAVLSLLFSIVQTKLIKWHLSFFFIGLFLYQGIQNETDFFSDRFKALLILYILATYLSYFLGLWINDIRKKSFFYFLGKRRLENNCRHLSAFITKTMRSVGTVDSMSSSLDTDYKKQIQSIQCDGTKNYLITGFFFTDIYKCLQSLEKNPVYTKKNAINEFQREWELFQNYLREKLIAMNLKLTINSDSIIAGYSLGDTNESSNITISKLQKKNIFQILFLAFEILEFSYKTRLVIEQRGSQGWYSTALIALGPAIYIQNGLNNPNFVFRGPVINSIEEGLKKNSIESDIESKYKSHAWLKPQAHRDKICLHSQLWSLCKTHFQKDNTNDLGDWVYPESLFSEYTQNNNVLEANQHFWTSIDAEELKIQL